MSWGVSAAVHAALETALPAETEAVTYPPSVIEEMPSASSAPVVPPETMDVFLPRRRPPRPATTTPARSTPSRPSGPVRPQRLISLRTWPCWTRCSAACSAWPDPRDTGVHVTRVPAPPSPAAGWR